MKMQAPTSPRQYRGRVAGAVVDCPLCPGNMGVRRNRLAQHGVTVHGLVDKRRARRGRRKAVAA